MATTSTADEAGPSTQPSVRLRERPPTPTPPSPKKKKAEPEKKKIEIEVVDKKYRKDFDDCERTTHYERKQELGNDILDALKIIFKHHRCAVTAVHKLSFSTDKTTYNFIFNDQADAEAEERDDPTDDPTDETASPSETLEHRTVPKVPPIELAQLQSVVHGNDSCGCTRGMYRCLASNQPEMKRDYLVQQTKYAMEDEMAKKVPISPILDEPSTPAALSTASTASTEPSTNAAPSSTNRPIGYQRSLKDILTHILDEKALEQIFSKQSDRVIRLKFGGDGRKVGRKTNHILCAIQVLNLGDKQGSPDRLHSIVVASGKESSDLLKKILRRAEKELKDLEKNKLEIRGEKFDVQCFLVSDWKFCALLLGLVAANGKYFCLWCDCTDEDRSCRTKTWKTREEGTVPNGQVRDPIISFLFRRILVDLLHLLLRIFDTLFKCVIEEAYMQQGNRCQSCFERKCAKGCDCSCHQDVLLKFVEQAHAVGVTLEFWHKATNDDHDEHEGGTLRWTALMGPDKYKLLQHLSFEGILNPERAQQTRYLWDLFLRVYDLANQKKCLNDEEIETVGREAKRFVDTFCGKSFGQKDDPDYIAGLYPNVNPTPYMHSLESHLTESLQMAKEIGIPLTLLSTQSLEHVNHQQNLFYFRNSRRGMNGESPLLELLNKENRLLYKINPQNCKKSTRVLIKRCL